MTDLSIHWVHRSFGWFCHAGSQYVLKIIYSCHKFRLTKTNIHLSSISYVKNLNYRFVLSYVCGLYRRHVKKVLTKKGGHRQSLPCPLIQYRELEEASDKEPDFWPYSVATHARLNDLKLHTAKIPFLMRRLVL